MSLTAGAAAALLGAAAGPAGSVALRRLRSPQPAIQAEYFALAQSRRAQGCRSVVGAVVCAAIGLRLGWTATLPVWAVIGGVGTLLGAVDWRTRQLPGAIVNPCLLFSAALIIAISAGTADWASLLFAAGGWAVAGGLFGLIWLVSPRGLGYGDVRLAALLAMCLGWCDATALLPALFLALVLAAGAGLLLRLGRWLHRGQPIPLGPFLIAGAVTAVLLRQSA